MSGSFLWSGVICVHHASFPGVVGLLKLHEPYTQSYQRAIYLLRDVRDVALSFLRLREVEGLTEESFEQYLTRFVQGQVGAYGSWQDHVTTWLGAAGQGRDILIVRYEDLVDDTAVKLNDMARFLGVLTNDATLEEVVANNRPALMRNRSTPFTAERMAVTVGDGTYGQLAHSLLGKGVGYSRADHNRYAIGRVSC